MESAPVWHGGSHALSAPPRPTPALPGHLAPNAFLSHPLSLYSLLSIRASLASPRPTPPRPVPLHNALPRCAAPPKRRSSKTQLETAFKDFIRTRELEGCAFQAPGRAMARPALPSL